MDCFRKFLLIGIFCAIFQRSFGRKWHTYEPYWESSLSSDESKIPKEKLVKINPEKSISGESLQNAHLSKINSDLSEEFQQKLPQSDNENLPSKLNSADFETLETQAGEHLVKVTSKKESNSLSYAPKGGEYDISINPKYSHIVEIIHRGDNIEKQNKPTLSYDATIQKEVEELKMPDSKKIIGTKWRENLDKFVETERNFEIFEDNVKDTEEYDEAEGESEFDADVKNLEDSDETERKTGGFCKSHEEDPEEYNEIEDTKEFNESDKDPEEYDEIEDTKEFSESDKDPEEYDEIEDTKEFSESDEDTEEYDESEEDIKEFSELNEDESQEYDETEKDTKDFSELEEDPEESNEIKKDIKVFEADYKVDSDESNDTEEKPEKFGAANEREETEDLSKSVFEDFVDANEKNAKETDNADEKGSEVFQDEGNTGVSSKTDKTDRDEIISGTIEDTEKFEGAYNTKESEMGNKQIFNDKESFFNEEFEGSGEEFINTNDRNTTKSGRILGMLSRQNETFPTCTTQRGEAGHCRRLGECLLSEALSNFNGFLQQLCLIRGALVGICCPDNPVIETVNPDDNATNELSAEEIEQPPEGCGSNTKTRIVGGSISVPHEWTWMVALMRRNRFYCGGVIINNWYILTAAHCVMGMNVKDLTVRLGEYDFNEQSKHTEDLSVSEIKRHAQFVTLTFQHDIALLKLKRSIKYSKFVGSICLPEEKARDYSDVKGTVVGWGTVSFGGAASPILRQVTVPVWKNKDCDRTYLLESIGDSFMCAGAPEKGEDACQGDSGGPLMTVNEKGRWEVIGLVSWGRRCGDPTYPGVYTRVTTYLDWIKQNAI